MSQPLRSHSYIRPGRLWGKNKQRVTGGKDAHRSAIRVSLTVYPSKGNGTFFFLLMPSPSTPSLLLIGCDSPSFSISRNLIWTNTLSHLSRAGPYVGLIDGAQTNANHGASFLIPATKHTLRRQRRICFQTTGVRVDIHTGHEI